MRDYYIVIPSFIIQHPELKQVDCIVYGHIRRYADMRQCFASNATLAQEMRISTRCLGSSLQRLENNKIIKRKIHYKKGTKQVVKRVISFADNHTGPQPKKLSTKIVSKSGALPAKVAYTPPAKVAYIKNQNKSIKNKEKKKRKESLPAATREAAQSALSQKKPKPVATRSKAIATSNLAITTDNSPKRSHSSIDAPTQPKSISMIACDLEAQITMLKEHVASAQTNYLHALQTEDTIKIRVKGKALGNAERMLKRLLN